MNFLMSQMFTVSDGTRPHTWECWLFTMKPCRMWFVCARPAWRSHCHQRMNCKLTGYHTVHCKLSVCQPCALTAPTHRCVQERGYNCCIPSINPLLNQRRHHSVKCPTQGGKSTLDLLLLLPYIWDTQCWYIVTVWEAKMWAVNNRGLLEN